MRRYILFYKYSPNDYGYESGHHLMYFDDENDAKAYLVRIKLALSVSSFNPKDINRVKSIVASLVVNDGHSPGSLHLAYPFDTL